MPFRRLSIVVDNLAIALLSAALATGSAPEWLWWPLNSDAFLWVTCGISAVAVAINVLMVAIEGVLHALGEEV